jgi:hypothetical protein
MAMHEIVLPADELNEFDLPRVCVVTGQTENVEFRPVKFSWYPPWVAVFILINLLIAAIIALAMTKKVQGSLPFTEEAYKAWKAGQLYFALSLVAGFVMFAAGIGVMANELIVPGALLLVLAFALPIFVGVRFTRHKGPVVKKIADGQITLKLPSDDAVRMILEHLNAGRGARLSQGEGAKKKIA